MRINFNLIIIVLYLFAVSCNNDNDCNLPNNPEPTEPESCDEIVELNVDFIAKIGCSYTMINGLDTLKIYLTGINDNRAYGIYCSNTIGTTAEIFPVVHFKNNRYSNEFIWLGCDGSSEYHPQNPNLPSIPIQNYKLTMMKLYPLSESQESPPMNIEEYEIRLIVQI